MKDFYKGKKLLITGACGTVGKEVVKQLLFFDTDEIRLMDNNETEMFYSLGKYQKQSNISCFLGDIRDYTRVEKLSENIDIIIHLAAFKHVILSEYNPFDLVQTNIIGVENIIRAATSCNVNHVIFTSSDKAVNPTNVMGASKLMGEKLITAANAVKGAHHAIFSSLRFGNVMGSRGSVIPIFVKQISEGGPVTITEDRMMRFFMTIEEAANLVLRSVTLSKGGEVFITKMQSVRICDLADVMIEILSPKYNYKPGEIKKVVIETKPGEKLYEELMNEEEVRRSIELEDVFVIIPALRSIYHNIDYEYPGTLSTRIEKTYTTNMQEPLNKKELKEYLVNKEIFENVEIKGVHI
ncbi:MAG: polysaccharide biosynthesis protein [Colwellia sp.]|nr:polysaccharide biosynthesis protein [Colwellia sp.]